MVLGSNTQDLVARVLGLSGANKGVFSEVKSNDHLGILVLETMAGRANGAEVVGITIKVEVLF